jgi:endonuclease/exonuclease/phosphatase family metal-dependent hydrolase
VPEACNRGASSLALRSISSIDLALSRVRVRVASYNVHGCVGADGHYDPARIARVLAELDADIVVLQEARAHTAGELARACAMEHVHGATLPRYGNAILARGRIHATRVFDLTVPRREPRGCVRAEVELASGPRATVVAVHLGLGRVERARQIDRLLDSVGPLAGADPLVVAGDFNDWPPGPARRLLGALTPARLGRSFPARFPLLSLDRIYARGLDAHRGRVHRSPLARIASDHLPVVADYLLAHAEDRGAVQVA